MEKALVAICVLAIFLSAGCVSQSGALPGDPFAWKGWKWGWQGLATVAMAAVISLLSIGYMAALFLNDEQMKAWVKNELGQVFYSLLILIFVVALVSFADDWLRAASTIAAKPEWSSYVNNAVCCDTAATTGCLGVVRNRACHMELAFDHLQLLYETVRESAISFLNNYWVYGFLSNLSVSIGFILDEKSAGLSTMPFAGLSMPADLFSVLFEMAVKIMMLIRAQQIFLDFIAYPFFPVFLSIGLILRILYFTRKLGGLLIAIALSAYIVFPMFYVISGGVLFGFLGGWGDAGWTAFGSTYDTSKSIDKGITADFGNSTKSKETIGQARINIDICNEDTENQNSMTSLGDAFASTWKLYEHGKWYSGFSDTVNNALPSGLFGETGPIATLATVMVFAVVTPFLALMTSLACIKAFSPLIGGDVEISVLSRLI